MLSPDSVSAGVSIVTMMSKTGYALVPKPESVLAKLVEMTRVGDLVSYSDVDNVDPEHLYRSLSYVANGIDPAHIATTEHSPTMDGAVTFLLGSMRSYLNYTRNVAGPAISEIIEKAMVQSQNWLTPTTNACVEIWHPPGLFVNDGFGKLIKQYEGESAIDVQIKRLINEAANYSVIGELMKTGVDSVDKEIAVWYGSLDAPTVESLWNTFFLGLDNGGMIGSNRVFTSKAAGLWEYFKSVKCGHDCALFVFLLARRLVEEHHPNSAVGIDVFDANIRRYLHAAGTALAEQCRAIDDAVLSKQLVRDVIKETETVITFGPVYETWIEQDTSSADILLSLTLRDIQKMYPYRVSFTVDDIESMKPVLAGAWVSNMSVSNFAQRDHQLRSARRALEDAFISQMDLISEDTTKLNPEEEELQEHYTPLRKVELVNQWREALMNDFSYVDVENIEAWVMKYMCKIRYHGRPAYELLSGIEMAMAGESTLSEEEAAFISTFRYICHWLIDQIVPAKDWDK